MSISFKGYKSDSLTFEAGEGLKAGMPVKLDQNGKAVVAANDDFFIGICTAIRDNWASVQTDGYAELEYTGSMPAYGFVHISAAGSGKVKVNESADTPYLKVIYLDTNSHTVGFIL